MPEYVYRAVTDKGLVVKNRVEDSSRQSLIKRLKSNGLMPIQVVQVGYMSKKQKKTKKNITNIEDIMKTANSTNILNHTAKRNITLKEKMNLQLAATEKVTTRDLVIFTQNFYLLKKANFNNIHALNTIIESTENLTLRGILEDILAGVESGDYIYTTMEYYSNVFPYIYVNMIKVGELSRFPYEFFKTSRSLLRQYSRYYEQSKENCNSKCFAICRTYYSFSSRNLSFCASYTECI